MNPTTLYIADIRSNATQGRSTGHLVPVARMYQELFAGHCEVRVAGGPVYGQYFNDEELLRLPYDVSGTTLRDKWHTMMNCRRLFRAAEGQTIVLQQSSVVTSFIGIVLFFHRKSRLLMIQYSRAGVSSFMKRLLYRLAKRKVDGVICPNEEVGRAYGRPYCLVPDYIYTGLQQTTVPYNQRTYDFCIVGRIAPEKGVVETAIALSCKPYKVLIAGKPQTEALRNELETVCRNAANIELHLVYIDEGDYDRYIRQSRYSVLNYQGEYSMRSSGVVFDMLFRGTPVIGRRCKALQFINEQKLGIVFEHLEEVDFASLLSATRFEHFQQHIQTYRQSHQQYAAELKRFTIRI